MVTYTVTNWILTLELGSKLVHSIYIWSIYSTFLVICAATDPRHLFIWS